MLNRVLRPVRKEIFNKNRKFFASWQMIKSLRLLNVLVDTIRCLMFFSWFLAKGFRFNRSTAVICCNNFRWLSCVTVFITWNRELAAKSFPYVLKTLRFQRTSFFCLSWAFFAAIDFFGYLLKGLSQ